LTECRLCDRDRMARGFPPPFGQEVLAANLTAPYDKTTLGDTQQSKDRFITEAYDEAGQLPPVTDGKRAMPVR